MLLPLKNYCNEIAEGPSRILMVNRQSSLRFFLCVFFSLSMQFAVFRNDLWIKAVEKKRIMKLAVAIKNFLYFSWFFSFEFSRKIKNINFILNMIQVLGFHETQFYLNANHFSYFPVEKSGQVKSSSRM